MANKFMSPNHREVIYAQDSATGLATYVTATNHVLDVGATFSATSLAINDGTTTSRKATVLGLADSNPLTVAITDGNGDQITSFGGGTQYTDAGTPPAHPVGPTLEWNNAGAWATVGSAAPLPVTANAGTNLNTSLLATSANLTAGSQKTQIVDGSGNVIASTSNALNVTLTAGAAVIGHVVTDSGSVTAATLSAETTKVIGVTRTADGSGNLLTSTTNALDVNVKNTSLAVTQAAPTTIFDGKTSTVTAGTRVTLAASQAVVGVTVKALSTNTGFIYVGNASVASTNGLQLQAGESVSFDIANLNTINIDSSVSGEGVTYLAVA